MYAIRSYYVFFLPLHAKQIFDVHTKEKKGDKIWEINKKIYKIALDFLLKGKYITLAVLIIFIFTSTFILLKSSKFQFFPVITSYSIHYTKLYEKICLNKEYQ